MNLPNNRSYAEKKVELPEAEVHDRHCTFQSVKEEIIKMSENGYARKVNLVANRLFTIHDSSDPSQWRYVDSKRNPADVAFRGKTSLHCDKTEMWFSGPDFLW